MANLRLVLVLLDLLYEVKNTQWTNCIDTDNQEASESIRELGYQLRSVERTRHFAPPVWSWLQRLLGIYYDATWK